VAFGRKVPEGYLPVFSVNTPKEARDLIVAACPMDLQGNYYARELAGEGNQTLENLQRFSDKLAQVWTQLQARSQTRRQRDA